MKNMVIKGLVIVCTIGVYFNVTQYLDNTTLEDKIELQQETIESLENQIDNLEEIITTLQEENEPDEVVDSCLKLNEITLTIIDGDFTHSITHCTNKALLGDALDELVDVMNIVYDPRYDKDYVYGRMVVSFYNHPVEYGEYYQILVDGEYASYGIDFVELEEGVIYTFELVRWQS